MIVNYRGLRKLTKESGHRTFLLLIFLTCFMAFVSYAHQLVSLEKNAAKFIPTNGEIIEVFIASPEIADIKVTEGRGVYVYGKKTGSTTLFISYAGGRQDEIGISVNHNLEALTRMISSLYPEEEIKATSAPNGIMLSGSASSTKIVSDIENMASQFIDKGEKIVNNITISSATQVYLKVRVAEIRRDVLTRINPNWAFNAINMDNKFSATVMTGRNPLNALGGFDRKTTGTNVPFGSLGFRFNDGISDYTNLLDMIDQEGLGTVLAEPNLIAVSGENASFLVGGEFPYPVPQDNNRITIEFKQFGISLSFTPTVLSPDLIRLHVRPEVSELDAVNRLQFPVGGGVAEIPSIKTRKAETAVELSSGQSLAMAGLLSHDMANAVTDFPGLKDIPILGALLRSTEFRRKETELVIIVTPYIVNPTAPKNLKVPTENLRYESTLETLFMRRLNKTPEGGARMKSIAGFYTD